MAFNQPLKGLIEPRAASWASATAADRLAFYKEAGRIAVERKRGELARGIGANGRLMKARKRARSDGANGPVMTPHDAASRTSRLLDDRATANGVTLYWHAGLSRGSRTAWGTILGFHAEGAGHLPVRDVRLSRRGIGLVRAEMEKWWAARVREQGRLESRKPAPGRSPLARLKDAAKGAFHAARRIFAKKPPATSTDAATRRAQADLIRRYPMLKDYLLDPKDGFR